MENAIDLNGFIQAMTERAYGGVKAACDGLTDEQLWYQLTPDSNSIARLVWHLSRVKDRLTSTITGESEVWAADDWAVQFGLDLEGTGIGDSPEKVAAFHIGRYPLFGYLDDAHHATMRRLSKITAEQFDQPVVYVLGDSRPVCTALVGTVGDSSQHNGQIAYLRGMITRMGWRERTGRH